MGMYDTVLLKCTKCGGIVSFQSKSGDCCMNTYEFDFAPPEVLAGIYDDHNWSCGSCGKRYSVKLTSNKVGVTLEGERSVKAMYVFGAIVIGVLFYVMFVGV